jgi:cyclase
MLKNRLIYTLIYNNGSYMLSRNFRIQTVGDLDWLKEYYNFNAIAFSIDELVVLNVERKQKNIGKFSENLIQLSKNCFIPISAGGGIRSLDDAYKLLNSGVDKLVVNTPIIEKPDLVAELARTFGSQCIIASIDCKKEQNGYDVYIQDGSKNSGLKMEDVLQKAERLGVGEIYLTSMERDGTGQGLDMELIERAGHLTTLPIIASGGVGKYEHFIECMKKGYAVATANIYNFIVDGLIKARQTIQKQGIELAAWDYNLESLHDYFKKNLVI